MGIVESAQMAQDYWMFSKGEEWNRRDYKLGKSALNIDMVNTIREDLRDLLAQRNGRIDNLMLVNTLLFSFSFGFVSEGTFPEHEDASIDLTLLCIYSALLALCLAFPFWSIFFALECKQKLDHFLNFILSEEHTQRMKIDAWLKYYDKFDVYWDQSCEFYYLCAQNFFWLGMLCCLMECTVLTCLNFWIWYPKVITYVFASLMACTLSIAFLILAFRSSKAAVRKCKGISRRERRDNAAIRNLMAATRKEQKKAQKRERRRNQALSTSEASQSTNDMPPQEAYSVEKDRMLPRDDDDDEDFDDRSEVESKQSSGVVPTLVKQISRPFGLFAQPIRAGTESLLLNSS